MEFEAKRAEEAYEIEVVLEHVGRLKTWSRTAAAALREGTDLFWFVASTEPKRKATVLVKNRTTGQVLTHFDYRVESEANQHANDLRRRLGEMTINEFRFDVGI